MVIWRDVDHGLWWLRLYLFLSIVVSLLRFETNLQLGQPPNRWLLHAGLERCAAWFQSFRWTCAAFFQLADTWVMNRFWRPRSRIHDSNSGLSLLLLGHIPWWKIIGKYGKVSSVRQPGSWLRSSGRKAVGHHIRHCSLFPKEGWVKTYDTLP